MMAAASTSKTRIPIKLSPHSFAPRQDNDTTPSYHALHHDPLVGLLQLGGATLQLSGNNGSNGVSSSSSGMGSAVSVSAADGTKLNGTMKIADEHDYVLLYDEASRSYVLHKLSSVTHLQPSSSSTLGTKATTPKHRSNADSSNHAAAKPSTNSPAIARTPQSTNSPSIASSSKSNAVRARQTSTNNTYLSPSVSAAGSGTAKKSANQNKHSNNGYDSSPTPSTVGKNTPATYGLGISSTAGPSPSIRNPPSHSASQKGKAAVHEVEEFDMGTSDEDLLTSTLQLPPSQGSLPLSTIKPDSGSRHRQFAATSTSLSMSSNQDVVMSDSSSEDEGDFADLANDLESSLVGQGPFARAGGAGGGGAGTQHTLISSDDEDDDSDFVNAFAEQVKPASSGQPFHQPRPPQQQYQQAAPRAAPQQPPRQNLSAPSQAPSQASRPSQAGKKLPTTRTYDSDIASSSESDDSD